MSRPSRLGPQATHTFQAIPQAPPSIEAPAWLVMPLLVWNTWQLRWIETLEEMMAVRHGG